MSRKPVLTIAGLVLLLGAAPAFSQTPSSAPAANPAGATAPAPLTNADVIGLVHAGLPADVIAAKIKSSATAFDTSPAALEKLKPAGVPDPVILAMVGAGRAPTLASAAVGAPGKRRVFVAADAVTYSHWRMAGGSSFSASLTPSPSGELGSAGGGGGFAGHGEAGVDPQRDEVIKTFLQRCPEVSVTTNPASADFAADVEREPNKGLIRKRNKWIVSDKQGNVLGAGSDRSIGNAVKDACQAITGKSAE